MNSEIPDEELSPVHEKSVSRSDRVSRAIKIRLAMLLAMLVGVIFLMKEVGDPKFWSWIEKMEPPKKTQPIQAPASLGDDDQDSQHPDRQDSETLGPVSVDDFQSQTSDPSAIKNRSASGKNRTFDANGSSNMETLDGLQPVSPEDMPTNTVSESRATDEALRSLIAEQSVDNSHPKPNDEITASGYPLAARQFWSNTLQKMSFDQKRNLFRMLRELRNAQALDESRFGDYQKLMKTISSHRSFYQRDLLDQLAVLSDGTAEKTQRANEAFESQDVWENHLQPAFEAALSGKELTPSQIQQIVRLQTALDPFAYSDIQDHTSLGWKGDSPSWVRMWEKVTSGQLSAPESVTRLQLTSQPEYYRGKAVSIAGWVRLGNRRQLHQSELGVAHYFVLWVRPADTKSGPYCVYCLNLPDEFPELGSERIEINERVELTGVFFKLRTFVDAGSTVSECPVILASTLTRFESSNPLEVNKWKPSWPLLIAFLILMPLAATTIAWMAYKNSEIPRYQPGQKTTQKINSSLNDLVGDPNVQTEHEKIQQLYQDDEIP